MAVRLPKRRCPRGRWRISFALPGTERFIDLHAEFACDGAREEAGLRFLETSPQAMQQLREWLQQNSSEVEPEDPPIRCQLTDLSLGGCYLEIASPFPLSTCIVLSMRGRSGSPCSGCRARDAPGQRNGRAIQTKYARRGREIPHGFD